MTNPLLGHASPLQPGKPPRGHPFDLPPSDAPRSFPVPSSFRKPGAAPTSESPSPAVFLAVADEALSVLDGQIKTLERLWLSEPLGEVHNPEEITTLYRSLLACRDEVENAYREGLKRHARTMAENAARVSEHVTETFCAAFGIERARPTTPNDASKETT